MFLLFALGSDESSISSVYFVPGSGLHIQVKRTFIDRYVHGEPPRSYQRMYRIKKDGKRTFIIAIDPGLADHVLLSFLVAVGCHLVAW